MAVEAVHRLTLDQYHGMIDAGLLDTDERVEFIEGVIVDMSPKSARHERAIAELNQLLSRALEPERFIVRVAAPLTIERSEPEPDVVVAEVPLPRDEHPATAPLVIEVAVSSQTRDLVVKPSVYARADVREYWVADLDADHVVVHRDPVDGIYTSVERFADGSLAVAALGITVDVATLLAR